MNLALLFLSLTLTGLTGHVSSQAANPAKNGTQKHVVELRIFTDYKIEDDYTSLKIAKNGQNVTKVIENDIRVMIHGVNSYLSSLTKSGIDLQVRVKKIVRDMKIPGSKESYHNKIYLRTQTLRALKHSVPRYQTNFTHRYDFNVYYTGFYLKEENDGVEADSMCLKNKNMAILHFGGNQGTAKQTAHFIVESLVKSGPACTNIANYIDGQYRDWKSSNKFEFSPCVIKKLKEILSNVGVVKKPVSCKNLRGDQLAKCFARSLLAEAESWFSPKCLSEVHTTVAAPKPIDDLKDSDIFTVRGVCRRNVFDKFAIGVCTNFHKKNFVDACHILWCGTGNGCRPIQPTEGMVCGYGNKRCSKGKCLKSK